MKGGKPVMKTVSHPLKTRPLRMPLNGIDGECGVMKSLDYAVLRAYSIDGDAGSGTTRCLVVGTVDRKFRPEEPADPAAICSSARMQQIRSVASPGVAGSGRKMLDQRAAEIDIDDLKTAADAEHGPFGSHKKIEDGKLELIQIVADAYAAQVLFMKTGGIYIAAAGKQETVKALCAEIAIAYVLRLWAAFFKEMLFIKDGYCDAVHSRCMKSSCVIADILVDDGDCDFWLCCHFI